jgi:hypothetical protein
MRRAESLPGLGSRGAIMAASSGGVSSSSLRKGIVRVFGDAINFPPVAGAQLMMMPD